MSRLDLRGTARKTAPDIVKQALGRTCRPIVPARQHVYEIEYQRPLGAAVFDASVYRQDSRDPGHTAFLSGQRAGTAATMTCK